MTAQPELRRRFILVQRAIQEYDVPYSTMRQWIREGRLKAYRVPGGRQYRVCIEDLEALFVPVVSD